MITKEHVDIMIEKFKDVGLYNLCEDCKTVCNTTYKYCTTWRNICTWFAIENSKSIEEYKKMTILLATEQINLPDLEENNDGEITDDIVINKIKKLMKGIK